MQLRQVADAGQEFQSDKNQLSIFVLEQEDDADFEEMLQIYFVQLISVIFSMCIFFLKTHLES